MRDGYKTMDDDMWYPSYSSSESWANQIEAGQTTG